MEHAVASTSRCHSFFGHILCRLMDDDTSGALNPKSAAGSSGGSGLVGVLPTAAELAAAWMVQRFGALEARAPIEPPQVGGEDGEALPLSTRPPADMVRGGVDVT